MTVRSIKQLDPEEPQVPHDLPVSNPWSSWTELCLMGDLALNDCPTCRKDIPSSFMMFRPHGLEHWRCLACLSKSHHNGALFLARSTPTGEEDPGF